MAALIPLIAGIFGIAGTGTSIGLGAASAAAANKASTTAPTITPPAVPTTPQTPAPQISADQSNYQANTGNSVSPDFLQTLLSGGSLSPTGPYST